MGQAIGQLLPAAIGVALSPVPIIAVILMLGTPMAKRNGPAFAIGWVLGLVVVSVVVVVIAGGADAAGDGSDGVNWVKVLLGVLLLVLAMKQWRGRPKPGEEAEMPKWMATVDHITPGKSFVLGAALSGVNPKNLALTLAASATIAQAGLSTGDELVAVAVFVIIGSITVAGSVLFYVLATDKAKGPLESIKVFMAQHNAAIMMVILLILGVKLIGDGFGGLSV